MARTRDQREFLRPEWDLLLAAARAGRPAPPAKVAPRNIDWPYVSRLALRHGLVTALHRYFTASGAHGVPQHVLEHVRFQSERNGLRNKFLARELGKILAAFREHRIRAVALRGLVLGPVIYGDLAVRELADLDILVRRRDTPDAAKVLRSLHYAPMSSLAPEQETAYLSFHPEHGFIRGDQRVHLELRWTPVSEFVRSERGAEPFWEQLEAAPLIDGVTVDVLAPHNLTLLLCLHGARQGWGCVGLVRDVAEWIGGPRRIDWERTVAAARALGAERALRVGLLLTADLLGASLPDGFELRLGRDPKAVRLARRAAAGLGMGTQTREAAQRTVFHLALREGVARKARFVFGPLVIPTAPDWAWLSLPRPLRGLYYVLRPFRLVASRLGLVTRPPPTALAPFVATPTEVIERMLDLAEVGPSDVVYDLGCGDGRIVVAAAERRGASGVGIDIDSDLVRQSEERARLAGVERQVRFMCADARTSNVSEATVLFLYLYSGPGLDLCLALRSQLKPGTRIVLHDNELLFDPMTLRWIPWRRESVLDRDGVPHSLQAWKVAGSGPEVLVSLDSASLDGRAEVREKTADSE